MIIDQLCSNKIKELYIKSILIPCYNGISTAILSFPGAGKTLEVSYFCKNAPLLENYKPKHLFTILNIELFDTDETASFVNTLNFLLTYFSSQFNTTQIGYIKQYSEKKDLDINDFISLITKLTQEGFSITIVIDSVNRILTEQKTNKYAKMISFLDTVRNINTAKVTYIFLALREFDNTMLRIIKPLMSVFTQNIIFGKDLMFDIGGMDYMFEYHEKHFNLKFTKAFKDLLKKMCYGDPSLFHIFINKVKADSKFQEDIVIKKEISQLPSDVLENIFYRYDKVLNTLLPNTLNSLLNFSNSLEEPSDYLITSGLFIKDIKNKSFIPFNPVFNYYLHNTDISKFIINKTTISPKENTNNLSFNPKTDLNGNEFLIFKLLLNNINTLVSRETIAKSLWEDNWEDKYSDWAIDQLISRLRAKLLDTNYFLKTLKGKGFMLLDTLNS